MKQQLGVYLNTIGYQVIPSNIPEFTIYYQPQNNCVNVILLVDYCQGLHITAEQFVSIKDNIKKLFEEKGIYNVHILSLILSNNLEKAKKLGIEEDFCWIIAERDRKLIIYENQVPDYYGLRKKLENWLDHPSAARDGGQKTEKQGKHRNIPWVVSGLCAANILVFLICAFTGDLLYNVGILVGSVVLDEGELYRMFTSLFLHADIQHLFNNMILLFFVGELIEKELGHVKTAILFIGAGFVGNIFSIVYDYYTAAAGGSLGASGAVFGLVGGLLFLVMLHRGRLESVTIGRLLFMLAYSLYSGFVGTNIDNAAHIGGLISGFILTLLLYAMSSRKKSTKGENHYEG